MPKTNNKAQAQVQALLDEFKAINDKAKDYLTDLNRRIAEQDLKYAQHSVQHDINLMQAAKAVLLSKKK